MNMYNKVMIALLICLTTITSCKKDNENSTVSLQKEVAENYAEIVLANYQDAKTKALTLQTALKALVATPTEKTLNTARQAWIDSRPSYLQTEAFRFYDGPIDNEDGPEGEMNGWPLDEAYVDYVEGDLDAGIINRPDLYPTIDTDLIRSLNEEGGETNLSSGYHVIEFLLWGQDLNASSGDAGKRPYTDYITTGGGTASNQARRGQYLLAAMDILIEDFDFLIEAWQPNQDNFRADFVANPTVYLRKVITGLDAFAAGEIGGERMQVAYDTQNQEDEHSCFSDNTHNDHIYDIQGIINVYTGKYPTLTTTVSGSSLSDLVKRHDATLDTEILALLAECKTSAQSIQNPFDEAILNEVERAKIAATIQKLTELSAKLKLAFYAIK